MAYAVQRRWPRFRVTAAAVVEFYSPSGSQAEVVGGSTRDLGAGGVYVVSEEVVVAGVRVLVTVDLGRLGAAFTSTGSVVRTEECGFAVQFDDTVADAIHLQATPC